MDANWKTYMIAEHHRQQRLREAERFRLAQVAQGHGRQALTALAAALGALLAAVHIG